METLAQIRILSRDIIPQQIGYLRDKLWSPQTEISHSVSFTRSHPVTSPQHLIPRPSPQSALCVTFHFNTLFWWTSTFPFGKYASHPLWLLRACRPYCLGITRERSSLYCLREAAAELPNDPDSSGTSCLQCTRVGPSHQGSMEERMACQLETKMVNQDWSFYFELHSFLLPSSLLSLILKVLFWGNSGAYIEVTWQIVQHPVKNWNRPPC